MPEYIAVLVEDDAEQVPQATSLFESAGFTVQHFFDSSSATRGLEQLNGAADLIILDRRLPVTLGEEPTDDVGDLLLTTVTSRYPDTPVIVFTGFSDYEHLQSSTQQRGSLTLRNGAISVDRVSTFRKGQAPEAKACAQRLHGLLRQLDDVEILPDTGLGELAPADRRLLKRVAFEYLGASISVAALDGGATSADVWRCTIDGEGGALAQIVVKKTKGPTPVYGFQALLPAHLAAATTNVVAGLCWGLQASIIQAAGRNALSLGLLVVRDPSSAARATLALTTVLDEMPAGSIAHRPLSDVAGVFATWDQIEAAATSHGIPLPPSTLNVTTRLAPQHGDFHTGNVLVVGDEPIIIDFDSQGDGSRLTDPVALFFGGSFHKSSPLRESAWPTSASFDSLDTDMWLEDCPQSEFFRVCVEWIERRTEGPRELAAVLLGFAARQLGYDDVCDDARLRDASIALARTAAKHLTSS